LTGKNHFPWYYGDFMTHRIKIIRVFISGVIIAAAAFGFQSQAAKTPSINLGDFILEYVKGDQIPGSSAAIVVKERLVWAKGSGWADVEKKIPLTADTIQNIGSISKTITATAVMQLWKKEAFDLDDAINGHLPFRIRNTVFPDAPITSRQLLTHKSSIKDGPAYGEIANRLFDEALKRKEAGTAIKK